jgi:hypothetical protein
VRCVGVGWQTDPTWETKPSHDGHASRSEARDGGAAHGQATPAPWHVWMNRRTIETACSLQSNKYSLGYNVQHLQGNLEHIDLELGRNRSFEQTTASDFWKTSRNHGCGVRRSPTCPFGPPKPWGALPGGAHLIPSLPSRLELYDAGEARHETCRSYPKLGRPVARPFAIPFNTGQHRHDAGLRRSQSTMIYPS